jgi:hypothetical protein
MSGNTKIKTKDGRVAWGGSSFNKKYNWEDELVDIIKDCISKDIAILTEVKVKMGGRYEVSEKTWKNRITDMKRKYKLV